MDLSTALWADLKTDADRAKWLLLGRGYDTGVVAHTIQADLAMAYHRLALLTGTADVTGVVGGEAPLNGIAAHDARTPGMGGNE